MIKRPAIFFDRDNTLIANDGYLGDPGAVVLVDGAAEAVARARAMGYVVVTVSNQSGVARGMFTEDAVRAVNRRMDELLKGQNPAAVVDRHEFCPYHPTAKVETYRQDSPLRKPAPGMIHRAAIALDLDTPKSWVIGDAPRDIESGRAAGCRTILFVDPNLPKSPAAGDGSGSAAARPDFVASSLAEAMDIIERERHPRRPVRIPPAHGTVGAAVGAAQAVASSTTTATVRETAPRPAATGAGGVGRNGTDEDEGTNARLESLSMQILQELRRRNERPHADFSVPKLLAYILQVVVLALLFVAYLGHQNGEGLQTMLLFGVVLQVMVASLLLMSSHR